MADRRIEEGTYRGKGIAGSEQYGATSNNNDQIVLSLELLDIGERVSTFLVFTEKNAPYCIERLRALGWEGDDLSNLAGIDRNEVHVSVTYETYQGKESMKVQIVTGGGGFTIQAPMQDQQKREFAARFRDLAKTTRVPAAGNPEGGATFPYGANAPQNQQAPARQERAAATGTGGRAKF